jgi:hypothetical protein
MDQMALQVAFVSIGRRSLEVLNKFAIVLLCAIWEAYCEDLADKALRLWVWGVFTRLYSRTGFWLVG